MIDRELDEADVYRLIAKLQKADCFEIFQNLNKQIIRYLNLEWNVKPSDEEILNVICQFYGKDDENLDKLFNAVTEDEYTMLAAMTYGLLVE